MKVIFIVLDFGLAIRNILKNRLFDILKFHKDLKIVVFSPIADEAFKEEYGGDNVVIELNPKHRNILTKIIYSMGKYIWEKKTKIFSFKDKRLGKKQGIMSIFLKVTSGISDYSSLLSAINRINLFFFRNPLSGYYFKKYNPDLVFY
ncbi:MAG: hypothetical protein HZA07_04240, partial [Nitrospirae bacterium]|nr:hypothetical protein [Nitrospirota bacterium]